VSALRPEHILSVRRNSKISTNNCVVRFSQARIRLEIEIGLVFNQSEERKPISSLVNFALIGQNLIQFQSLV